MDEDLDFTQRRSGSGKYRVGFSLPFHPFEVTSPFLKGLNENQPRVWESPVQLGRSRTHSNIEYNVGHESEFAIMSKDAREGSPHAARPIYLNSVGSERSHRDRP